MNLKLISSTALRQWFQSHLGPHAILILEGLRAQHGSNLAAENAFSLKQSPTEESTTEFNLKLITAIPKSMLKYELETSVFSVWENWAWHFGKLMKVLFSDSERERENSDYAISNCKQSPFMLYINEALSYPRLLKTQKPSCLHSFMCCGPWAVHFRAEECTSGYIFPVYIFSSYSSRTQLQCAQK